MIVQLLEIDTGVTKDNKPYYRLNVLGNFSDYGKIKKSTVDINCTLEQYELVKDEIGKNINIEVVIPKPQYPLTLLEVFDTESEVFS